MALSAQRQVFIAEYFRYNFNGAEAARQAGYSAKTARQIASKLLRAPEIRAEVDARIRDLTMSAHEVLMRQTEIGRGTMQYFSKVVDGELVHDFTDAADKLYLIKKFKRTKETRTIPGRGDEPPTVIVEEQFEFEVGDFQRAQEMLGKHHKLFSERIVVTDWRADAINDIRAGKLLFEPLVEAIGETLARELFGAAGLPVPGEAGAGEAEE